VSAPTDPVRTAPRERRWRKSRTAAILLLLLLVLLLLLRQCGQEPSKLPAPGAGSRADSLRLLDSLRRTDSLLHARLRADSLRLDSLRRVDSLRVSDSLSRARERRYERWRLARIADSISRARSDSLRRADSLRVLDSLASLRRVRTDTIPPHVYADPAAGIHAAPVEVAVLSEEPRVVPLCGTDSAQLHECRDLVRIVERTTLWISGIDTAGNRARPQRLEYVIDPDASRCGPRRVLVSPEPPLDGSPAAPSFCMDAFEYPNDPNGLPRTSVNWEEASALCAKSGKRLCSVQELTDACRGPKEWTYPYGDTYIPGHCQDAEGALSRGMSRPACRSWAGAFHLVGNAWEWSSTPTGSTYFAVGGTFVDGPEDRCGRTTRSFFRQNRYEAVGFRCCSEVPPDR
jgi:hypothetical protein